MLNTITSAAREYANRPKDERYPSVDALVEAAAHEKQLSAERSYNLKDLRAVADGENVLIQSPKGAARFTHWAFGQLARMVGAPAGYLRDLPPGLAADCLNHGIKESPTGSTASLLVRAPNGNPEPTVRACTSDSYARVWDSELYSAVVNQITRQDSRWTLPPTWSGESAGAYRGDRDSFLILVNGGSIVTDPSLMNRPSYSPGATPTDGGTGAPTAGANTGKGPSDGMYRGLLIRNSEVGASAITIETILYRYICGNHILWGAVVDKRFRRRHVGTKVVRDAIREISSFAYQYVQQSGDRDAAIIRTLIDRELASTREAVIDELRTIGATKEQAESAYAACEQYESASPRSFWGAAQGLTRISQQSGYQDDRFVLDQLAAKVLSRGARLVAA